LDDESKAEKLAEDRASTAVTDALAPVCAARFFRPAVWRRFDSGFGHDHPYRPRLSQVSAQGRPLTNNRKCPHSS
jgi:hypothetical protein